MHNTETSLIKVNNIYSLLDKSNVLEPIKLEAASNNFRMSGTETINTISKTLNTDLAYETLEYQKMKKRLIINNEKCICGLTITNASYNHHSCPQDNQERKLCPNCGMW